LKAGDFIKNLESVKLDKEMYYTASPNSNLKYRLLLPGITVFIVAVLGNNFLDVGQIFVIFKKEDLGELINFFKRIKIEHIWVLDDNVVCDEYVPQVL